MVQGRSVIAGVLGVICAVAILALLTLTQVGAVFGPAIAMVPSNSSTASAAEAIVSSNNSSATYAKVTPSVPNLMARIGPSPSSEQTIGSPSLSISNILLLGVVSLVISLGVVFVVSRRLD